MIDSIGGFVQHNLIVFVALILLPIKWLVILVCKDSEAEAVAIMSVPEDMSYVALGLVMGDVVNGSGSFHQHFKGSQHVSIDLFITVFFNLSVALLAHMLSQPCNRHFRLWRAAVKSKAADEDSKQGSLGLPNAADNIDTLKLRHLFSMLYAVQLGFILLWLHWIAKVVANT